MTSEFSLIKHLRRKIPPDSGDVICGIGDDCAVLRQNPHSYLLITTDCQIEGVHFKWDYFTPALLAERVFAVNLSDIAAMGGTPRQALIDLRLSPKFSDKHLEELTDALAQAAARYDVDIVGGNTAVSPHEFSVGMTLLGEVSPAHCKFRKGARPGDLIYLTGPLGASALGFKQLLASQRNTLFTEAHLKPRPHLPEGAFLGSRPEVTALMDVSDGLSLDLSHILGASGVGALIDEKLLPCLPGFFEAAAQSGLNPLELSLCGGEDYVLLFTLDAARRDIFEKEMRAAGFAFTAIGEIRKEKGIILRDKFGKESVRHPQGFDHFKNQLF